MGQIPNDNEYKWFKTSAANHVIEESKTRTNDLYIPPAVIKDWGFIHESVDNADVNCETVDEKGTFHVLLHTLYQNNLLSDKNYVTNNQIKREPSRSLALIPELEVLTTPLPYNPHRVCPVPPRTEDALTIIKETKYFDNITSRVCDKAWV